MYVMHSGCSLPSLRLSGYSVIFHPCPSSPFPTVTFHIRDFGLVSHRDLTRAYGPLCGHALGTVSGNLVDPLMGPQLHTMPPAPES